MREKMLLFVAVTFASGCAGGGRNRPPVEAMQPQVKDLSDNPPSVRIEYRERVSEEGALPYVFVEGTMSGTVRGTAGYTVPVQIHYPTEGGNGTAVLELTNSALLFFHLAARGDRAGDRRSGADDIDELEAMQVNFGWAGAREHLLRNGYTHMAIQYSKTVTDFMGESPPDGRKRRHLCYGQIDRAKDGYALVRDATRRLAVYFLLNYLIRGENAGGEIDGFFVHAAGSKCLEPIDDTADCPEDAICVGSPRFSHWYTCPGPPPTNGAKVLAVDAQSDLDFNAGALAREDEIDDPNYVRWEVAGAPHVPVFAMDMTRRGAPHQNPMDWSPIWRSAFHHLTKWVKDGTPPPAGPRIQGRMIESENGPAWQPELDGDGNPLGGIRLPPIEAPMGIYTGFDYSWLDPEVNKGHRYALVFAYGGRFERFSDETLAERYPTDAHYKKQFEAAARRAFDAGYILKADLRRYIAAPR